MKIKKGISLIVLIVTIIVMIIIAGAIIISLTETNIIDQAEGATNKWNISTIKEQINIKNALRQGGIEGEDLGKVENGTLKELGIEGTNWDDKLLIQNGKLVYRPEMVTQEEATELTGMGISAGTYIGVVATSASFSNYQSTANLITADNLDDTINADTDAIIYILEDITLPTDYITIEEFNGILDGMNHTISGVTNTLFGKNKGTIKNIIAEGTVEYTYETGIISNTNYGLIYNCHNEVIIEDGTIVAGMANKNEGKIINCSNKANMVGYQFLAGICLYNYGTISNCFNSGNIELWGGSEPSAGIVLYSDTKIKNCYNTGNITGYGHGNGIICSSYNSSVFAKVENCYNIGSIATDGNNHGIGGDDVQNCYSTDKSLILFAKDTSNINCDWIENLGATDAEQKTELLKRLNEGNSTTVWVEDVNNINNGFPILYWQAQ